MRKPYMRLLVTLMLLALVGAVRADDYIDQVARGNEAFRAGNYSEALDDYHAAETEIPESPELEYNIASTLHEQGAYEEAVDRFTKALNSSDILQEARAHYNLGNTLFRMEDYQKAIEHYQRALEINPEDIDAKYNLELARRKLKDQMQQQEQNQDQQQQQEQQQQDQQQQQQQPQDQQQKEEEQQEQQQQQQEQQQQENQDEQQQPQPQPQEDEDEMSREDAERILDALRDDEQEMQEQRKQVKVRGDYTGKDW